jgi:predicted naringenin-chalcone synthase
MLTKEVINHVVPELGPLFVQLRGSFADNKEKGSESSLVASDCDWALHPGGIAIIKGAEAVLHLSEDQSRASREVYQSRGNCSSPSVLLVLDKLRNMGQGRDNVVAASFGPSLAVEMATMRRCR